MPAAPAYRPPAVIGPYGLLRGLPVWTPNIR